MSKITQALAHHQAGRLKQAEALYRQVLQGDPGHADALHLLGIIALQIGHSDRAVDYLSKAVDRRPQVPDYHYNLGLAFAGLGKSAEAARHFHRAIALKPDFAEAHNNLGNTLKEQGRPDEALECYQRALVLNPDYAAAHSNVGVILQHRGDAQGAIEHYQKAVAVDPTDADSQYNLANALRAMGRLNEAVSMYRNAIALRPNFFDAFVNLGATLKDAGALDSATETYERALALDPRSTAAWIQLGNALKSQGKIKDAIDRYKRAIDIDPGCAEAHYNLGNALRETGDLAQAIAVLRRATVLKPDFAEAYSNLGNALWESSQLTEALAVLQQALALKPHLSRAHNNLGNVLQARGRLAEAVAAYREALALQHEFPEARNNLGGVLQNQGQLDQALPAYRQALALNPDFAETHSNLLLSLHYQPNIEPEELFNEHLRWGERHAAPLASMIPAHSNERDPERCLRIGYVSPDFRAHSVSHFIAPVLAHHERSLYEVYCYYNVHQVDATTERLRGLADHWRDIAHLSDTEAAECVRADGIDILVDLAGHTAHNRLLLFARKPAPVQVAYLGYPDTRGFAAIDYWLSDVYADPPDETEQFYVEQIVRLAHGFNCYQPPLDCPKVSTLPVLSTRGVTFGSFNNIAKLSDWTIAVWSQVLTKLPEAKLMLKGRSLADQETRERIQQRFAEHGVTSERLELLGAFATESDHLTAYHRIDIALDTFPYNGHTTTCEALWMGVPVLTFAGKIHAGRVGVSLLTQAGLTELIAGSPEQYVTLAVELAHDVARLQALRQDLRERMAASALCDAHGFTRALETAYRRMWIKYCEASGK